MTYRLKPGLFRHRWKSSIVWFIGLLTCSSCAFAQDAPDSAHLVLEDLRAANVARSALATETAAWSQESERIRTVQDALSMEIARLTGELATVEHERDVAIGDANQTASPKDLDTLQVMLDGAAGMISQRLHALADNLPPGAIVQPSSSPPTFDDAIRCLDASERAADTASVEIVTGNLSGSTTAVRALRVSGAAAWWVSMDEQAAGTLLNTHGTVTLTALPPGPNSDAIREAMAIIEGRHPPHLVILPPPAPIRQTPDARSGAVP